MSDTLANLINSHPFCTTGLINPYCNSIILSMSLFVPEPYFLLGEETTSSWSNGPRIVCRNTYFSILHEVNLENHCHNFFSNSLDDGYILIGFPQKSLSSAN